MKTFKQVTEVTRNSVSRIANPGYITVFFGENSPTVYSMHKYTGATSWNSHEELVDVPKSLMDRYTKLSKEWDKMQDELQAIMPR